jgi:hypothetical protein
MKIDASSRLFDRHLIVKSVDDTRLDATVWVMFIKGSTTKGCGKPSLGGHGTQQWPKLLSSCGRVVASGRTGSPAFPDWGSPSPARR